MSAPGRVTALLDEVTPPEGRSGLTNPQKIALAQAIATAELAEQQRIANVLAVLGGSAAMVEHDWKTSAVESTKARTVWRNTLRADVRAALGLDG